MTTLALFAPPVTARDRLADLATTLVVHDAGEPCYPTEREDAYWTGFQFGLDGDHCRVGEVYSHSSLRWITENGLSFCQGRDDGLREHARRLGWSIAVDGGAMEHGGRVLHKFRRQFEAGWHAGQLERMYREAQLEAGHEADLAAWVEANKEAIVSRMGFWHESEEQRGGRFNLIRSEEQAG